MNDKEIRISSIGEYISEVKNIYEENKKSGCKESKHKHLFFRGHSKKRYELKPTVFRNTKVDEREILLDFVHYGPQHNISYNFERERINILTDMQHNEIPTRLLDWSIAPLNALFFATNNANCEDDAEVIVFNPWCYNQKIIDYKRHPRIHDIHIHARALLSTTNDFDYIKEYVKNEFNLQDSFWSSNNFRQHNLEKPMAIVSNYTNQRILHQRGVFTIHGTETKAIDEWSEFKDNSWRIVIDKCKKQDINNDLNKLYINHYSIYPDFTGMKIHIDKKYGLFNV